MINDIRVGIPVVGGKGWLGGVSHMELHIKAVASLPRQERPKLFLIVTDDSLDSYSWYQPFVDLFDGVIFMGSNLLKGRSVIKLPLIHCTDLDDLFTRIDFYFPVNFNVLPNHCSASWIHDFQHKHLPDFFSPQDIALRDGLCQRIANQSRLIFCSSRTVEKDFWGFYPESKAITKVLALRVSPEDNWYIGDPIAVQGKYNLPDRFVLCSNQFWVHKNHRVLFEAIALLRRCGQDVHLVCTGLTSDFRCPGYFQELQQYIIDLGVGDLIHILGQIPRLDQVQLIRRSLFLVQPSLFEGLSLIVQECRALGKTIVLSDLNVHSEHEYGILFNRADAGDLANKMAALLPISQPGPDLFRETETKLQAVGLTASYAREFCKLVEESQLLFNKNPTMNIKRTFNDHDVLIATSLMPRDDLTSQRRAIDSWRSLGFAIRSLNSPDDINALQPNFPDVEFVSTSPKAGIDYGKHYVLLADILEYLDKNGPRICGIVEADVCLYGADLVSCIAKETINCLIYQPKIKVDTINFVEGMTIQNLGCLFFDRQLIPYYPREEFPLSLPLWDYWMLLLTIIRKIPVKKITTPFAYHVNHQEQYNLDQILEIGEALTKYAPSPFALSVDTLARFQHILSQVIDSHSMDVAFYSLAILDAPG